MWSGRPWLHHAQLAPAMNLKLLDPRACVEAALAAYERGPAPLQSVEGFVRQIIGWREFIRGIYWTEGPAYETRNALDHHAPLPEAYWTAETPMRCVRESVGQVLEHAYGHHIQRLMVTGSLALLAGAHPKRVSDWYLGMFADGVEWATVPNVVGMSQHADGGVVGTKPYVSSGRYIDRMSDYCRGCALDPGESDGPRACPFTALYWNFLISHEDDFHQNPRMRMMMAQVRSMSPQRRAEVRISAGRALQSLNPGRDARGESRR
jgi:deoxyribodipyrimidine photolyase-related protein